MVTPMTIIWCDTFSAARSRQRPVPSGFEGRSVNPKYANLPTACVRGDIFDLHRHELVGIAARGCKTLIGSGLLHRGKIREGKYCFHIA